MQLENVEAYHCTLYSFCYLSFHFPFSTTQAQLLPKQIFVDKFTPSSIAFTDLDCWTEQFSAKGAQGPQIASFLSCQCLMRGYGRNFCADKVVCFLTSYLKNIFLALFTLLSDIGRSDDLQFFKLGKIWKKSVCCCELCALSVQACAMRAYM